MNVVTKSVARTDRAVPLSKLIGQVAVIATIQASSLGTMRLDRQASEDSDIAHNAKVGTMKGQVNRLPGAEKALSQIKSADREIRDLLKSFTTAWGPDRRLMPNVNIQPFLAEFTTLEANRNALVASFIANASTYIAQAIPNLGKYHVQPPTVAEIQASFSLSFDMTPVPDVLAYSTGDKEFEKEMKAKFEAAIESAYEEATKDALRKLAKPLESIVERMAAYDEREKEKAKGIDVGKEGTFKSTIITNIQDVAKVFRTFNLVGDPFLEKVAKELDGFASIDSDDLKKHAAIRADVSQRASDILKGLGNII